MKFKTLYVNRERYFSFKIDEEIGAYYLSIPVNNHLIDYLEYYKIPKSLFDGYPDNSDEVEDFIYKCRKGMMFHLSLYAKAKDRGEPMWPDELPGQASTAMSSVAEHYFQKPISSDNLSKSPHPTTSKSSFRKHLTYAMVVLFLAALVLFVWSKGFGKKTYIESEIDGTVEGVVLAQGKVRNLYKLYVITSDKQLALLDINDPGNFRKGVPVKLLVKTESDTGRRFYAIKSD